MKTYKSNLPQIVLQLRKGETLKCQIKCSKDSVDVFRKIWDNDSLPIYESMIALFLNRANNTLGWLKISQGGISGTVFDIRIVLTTALNCLASGIILCHNHPSGNSNPSESDTRLVHKLKEACSLMDMVVLDNVIITEDRYYSFADEGLL